MLPERQVLALDRGAAAEKYTQKALAYRAESIGRTESAAAYAEGNLQVYKEAGTSEVELSPAGDACGEICLPLAGLRKPTSQASGFIPLHPNCRCDWLPVID